MQLTASTDPHVRRVKCQLKGTEENYCALGLPEMLSLRSPLPRPQASTARSPTSSVRCRGSSWIWAACE